MSIPIHPTVTMYDSTKLATFQRCPREFLLHYVFGWNNPRNSHHLNFGVAWHLAMDYLLEHGPSLAVVKDAHNIFLTEWRKHYSEFDEAPFEPKTSANVLLALSTYLKDYPFHDYEIMHIEIPGVVTIGYEGLERDLYVNMDGIARHIPTGLYWDIDHKTTTQLSGAWQNSFPRSIQVGSYIHTLMSLFPPHEVGGALINGMVFRKNTLKGKGCEQAMVPVQRTLHQQGTWLHNTNATLFNIEGELNQLCNLTNPAAPPQLDYFPENKTSCIRYGSACPFYGICDGCSNPVRLLNKVGWEDAPPGFEKEFWNPSTHTNEKLDGAVAPTVDNFDTSGI